MATIDIHNLREKVGTLDLADEVFGAVNETAVGAVNHYRAAQRAALTPQEQETGSAPARNCEAEG